MKGRVHVSVASSLCLFAGTSMATDTHEEADPRQYLSPMVSYLVLDEDRDLSTHGMGGSLAYGRQIAERWWWESEAAAYGLDSGIENQTDFYQGAVTTGLLYAFGDRQSFTPFVVGAIGVIRDDVIPDDDDTYSFHANVGLGAVTGPIFDNGLKLRAEGRYLYDDFDGTRINASEGQGGFNDWRISLGLEIPLGYTRVKIEEKEKLVYKTREVEVMIEEPDSDGDGIADSRDECPNTLKGGDVDGKGCLLVNQTIAFHNIGFELDSDRITASTRPVLDRVTQSLRSQTNFNVEVVGHTDSTGSAEYNETLSETRAEAVRQYLIAHGVSSERLRASGAGELDPIASNETASGRAMNRRVEFRVTDQQE